MEDATEMGLSAAGGEQMSAGSNQNGAAALMSTHKSGFGLKNFHLVITVASLEKHVFVIGDSPEDSQKLNGREDILSHVLLHTTQEP